MWPYILLGVIAAVVLFWIGPSVCCFFVVFRRKKVKPFGRNFPYYCLPYRERMMADAERLNAYPHTAVSVIADDGVALVADRYGSGSRTTVIMMHGFGASPALNFATLAADLLDRGYDLLIPDQRGHARSGGNRSTLGVLEQHDLLKWTAFAAETAENIAVYGVSMGCVTVAYAADKLPGAVKALILDCGFCSPYRQMAQDMRKWHLPASIMMPLVRLTGKWVLGADLKREVGQSLERCTIPALFLHGTADVTVDLSQSRENFDRCAAEKVWLPVENANHTQGYLVGDDTVKQTLLGFIADHTHHEERNTL